jgi:iron complex transport system ATP-binding protein
MPRLSAQGLLVRYGSERALGPIDVPPCEPGSLTALVGPNAAGKSTLLRALAGLARLTAGRVELGGEPLHRLSRRDWARQVRYVPQLFGQLAALSVMDAVLVARMAAGGQVRASPSDRAAAAEVLIRIGIADLAERSVTDLSGGQQQLVALGIGLARPAPVLLLDEPTSALDLRRQLDLLTLVRRIAAEDRTVLIVALHDLNLALRFADRCLLMQHGRLVAAGSPEAVIGSEACEAVYNVRLARARSAAGHLMVEAQL